MMQKTLTLICFIFLGHFVQAQTKSPAVFLGYELGERFTPHYRIVDYFEHVAAQNRNVSIRYYGQTNEQRPLVMVIVSAQENMDKLEQIRMDNLRRAGLEEGNPQTNVPITWLSYNVHGNEAVSSEATMMTLWSLVDPAQSQTKSWLKNNVIIIDPCVNPDGRDRYAMWYNQKMNRRLQPDLQSIEHQEPWPGGRANHYLFDLNRDWAWQTQVESVQRMKCYQEWMPNMHLDFHEQGINSPYYFAPAAAPLHEQLSDFQWEFQNTFGRNTAHYFDENNWFYFTKEVFDLLYPSYGDTYPMYNGAIGMTIEQGGSGAAGVGVYTEEGDTLTLRERILHHHTTALSAIEVASENAEKLLDEFQRYFKENSESPRGKYKSFVIKGDNPQGKIDGLLEVLDKNNIRYRQSGKSGKLQGYAYQSGKQESFSLEEHDIIINAYQPKSVLTQVLFEPDPILQDSLTYDITSWALPYAHGLEAYALESKVSGEKDYERPAPFSNVADKAALAYLAPWDNVTHAKFLAALLREGIRVKLAEYAFEVDGASYSAGTLIITRGGNESVAAYHEKVTKMADQWGIRLGKASTGFVDKGKDFGSGSVPTISAPKVAVFSGEGTSSLNFGEIWHFFETQLDYPVTVIEAADISHYDLSGYTVLIMPSGSYGWKDEQRQKLLDWVSEGGKLIAIEGAMEQWVDREHGDLSTYLSDEEKAYFGKTDGKDAEELTVPYQERERFAISEYVAGAVFEVKMDPTYPLSFGVGEHYYSLKNNPKRYAFLNHGINAGIIDKLDQHRSGFIGYKAKSKLEKSLVFGVEPHGKGELVYMVDNPLFRSFWENGKLVMANAIFLVGN